MAIGQGVHDHVGGVRHQRQQHAGKQPVHQGFAERTQPLLVHLLVLRDASRKPCGNAAEPAGATPAAAAAAAATAAGAAAGAAAAAPAAPAASAAAAATVIPLVVYRPAVAVAVLAVDAAHGRRRGLGGFRGGNAPGGKGHDEEDEQGERVVIADILDQRRIDVIRAVQRWRWWWRPMTHRLRRRRRHCRHRHRRARARVAGWLAGRQNELADMDY